MTDTHRFRDQVDRLDTGITDAPDLAGIRAAGTGQRHRRRQGQLLAGGALAVVLVAPAVVLAGGNDTEVSDGAADAPAAASDAAAATGELADRGFGRGMRAAVAEVFPDATFESESLGDRWFWEDHEVLDFEAGDPPRWETLFTWGQDHELPGVSVLYVVAERQSPTPTVDPAATGYCEDGLYAVEKECRTWEVDGRVVVLHDGAQSRGQDPDNWIRDVEIYGAPATREMPALTSVGVVGTGETWAEARATMPDVDDLVALALDERLVLPEPERYPDDYPPNRPQG